MLAPDGARGKVGGDEALSGCPYHLIRKHVARTEATGRTPPVTIRLGLTAPLPI